MATKVNITAPPFLSLNPANNFSPSSDCLNPPLSLTLCPRHSPLHKKDKSSQTNFSGEKSVTTQTSPPASVLVSTVGGKQRRFFTNILPCRGDEDDSRSSVEEKDRSQERNQDFSQYQDIKCDNLPENIRDWDFVESYLLSDDQGKDLIANLNQSEQGLDLSTQQTSHHHHKAQQKGNNSFFSGI